MPIATHPDPTPAAGLLRALDMAASLTGRLSVLVQEVDIPPVSNLMGKMLIDVTEMTRQAEARSKGRGEELAALLRHLGTRLSLPVEVETLRCRPELVEERLVLQSRAHDAVLLVLDSSAAGQTGLATSLIFGSGGPVLICPPDEGPGHLSTVAVAWDGSRSAARAVRDGMPALKLAGSVAVLTLDDDDKPAEAADPQGIRRLLAYHGIRTEHVRRRLAGAAAGEMLQELALGTDAGLLVMGAYGHSRFRELVLGGATRSVLEQPRLPVLMSH